MRKNRKNKEPEKEINNKTDNGITPEINKKPDGTINSDDKAKDGDIAAVSPDVDVKKDGDAVVKSTDADVKKDGDTVVKNADADVKKDGDTAIENTEADVKKDEDIVVVDTDIEQKKDNKKHVKNINKKVRTAVVSICVLLILAGVGIGIWFYLPGVLKQVKSARPVKNEEVLSENGNTAEEQGELEAQYREIVKLDDFGQEKWNEGMILYEGKLYRYNSNLQNYLFMGIDNDNVAMPAADSISGGQADSLFLLTIDEKKRDVKIISINRNTIVPVDVYNKEGDFLVQMDLQICLQHGYGDGMKLSCMRSVEAVDRLFRNVPISGYISLNMGGLAAVNDAIGGVTLTPIETVIRGDAYIAQGTEVTLNGEQAYAYIRTRDTSKDGSSDDRLKRQQQYIIAFINKLLENPSLANKLYEAGKDYMVTSIDVPKLVSSSRDMTFSEENLFSIKGETVLQDGYERYNIDEKSMLDLIISAFYEEVGAN